MTTVLLDTRAWVWALFDAGRLSSAARNAIAGAGAVLVSPISAFEIGHKVRLGKWPEMSDRLDVLAADDEATTAPFSRAVAAAAATLDWPHRDPFDRLVAATAMVLRCPLVSKDAVFDRLGPRPDWPGRIW